MINPNFGPAEGFRFEQKVIAAIEGRDGWSTYTSTHDDHVRKIDCTAICPNGEERYVQVSLSDKSKRELARLAENNITNVTRRNASNVHEVLCSDCPLRSSCEHYAGEEPVADIIKLLSSALR